MWSFLPKSVPLSSKPNTEWRGTLIVVTTATVLVIVWTQRQRRRDEDKEVNEDGTTKERGRVGGTKKKFRGEFFEFDRSTRTQSDFYIIHKEVDEEDVPQTTEGGVGSEEKVIQDKQSYKKEPNVMYLPRVTTPARAVPSYRSIKCTGVHWPNLALNTMEKIPIIVRNSCLKSPRKSYDHSGVAVTGMDSIRRTRRAIAPEGTAGPRHRFEIVTQMDSFYPEEIDDDEVPIHFSEIERDPLDELDSSEEEQEDMVAFQRQYNATLGQIPDHSAMVMINPDDFIAGLASGPSQPQDQGGELGLYMELEEPSSIYFRDNTEVVSQIDSSQNRNSLIDLIAQEISAGSHLQGDLGEGDSSWVEESSIDLTENVTEVPSWKLPFI